MKRWVFVGAFLCAFVDLPIAFGQVNQIHVGPNAHVSQAHANYSLREVLLSADPTDANRLLGCGMVFSESENRWWTVAYLSTDGGKTWEPTLEVKRFPQSADPGCALGRGGLASFIAMGWGLLDPEKEKAGISVLGVYRSKDGGRTWIQQEDMPMHFEAIDRESLSIDTTLGRFSDRIYITGTTANRFLDGTVRNGFGVWCSRDGGVTFDGPVKRAVAPNRHVLLNANSVVLSDGTLVSLFGDLKNHQRGLSEARNTSEESNSVLESVTITEGGAALSEAVKVDDFFMAWGHKDSGLLAMGMPIIAADPGDGFSRDRVYATWADERDGRSAIRMTYSSDKGKTWSKSIVIDDVSAPTDNKKGPQNFLPTVAVNKAGVVVVTWYDRRDNLDGLGWYVRARASLDGGETWLPSVRVSEKPSTFSSPKNLYTFTYGESYGAQQSDEKEKTQNAIDVNVVFDPAQFFAGDYAGLVADASGTFHALWVDNRTGLPQIWSAAIVVNGKAIRNGEVTLSELKDVSHDVELEIASSNYDRASDTLTLGVRLKNWSKRSIQGPVKLRLVNISSRIGTPSAANADNHIAQPGAVWDFSALLKDNTLKPDEASAVRELIFRVNNPRDFFDGENLHTDLLKFDIRVLATGVDSQLNVQPTSRTSRTRCR